MLYTSHQSYRSGYQGVPHSTDTYEGYCEWSQQEHGSWMPQDWKKSEGSHFGPNFVFLATLIFVDTHQPTYDKIVTHHISIPICFFLRAISFLGIIFVNRLMSINYLFAFFSNIILLSGVSSRRHSPYALICQHKNVFFVYLLTFY